MKEEFPPLGWAVFGASLILLLTGATWTGPLLMATVALGVLWLAHGVARAQHDGACPARPSAAPTMRRQRATPPRSRRD